MKVSSWNQCSVNSCWLRQGNLRRGSRYVTTSCQVKKTQWNTHGHHQLKRVLVHLYGRLICLHHVGNILSIQQLNSVNKQATVSCQEDAWCLITPASNHSMVFPRFRAISAHRQLTLNRTRTTTRKEISPLYIKTKFNDLVINKNCLCNEVGKSLC